MSQPPGSSSTSPKSRLHKALYHLKIGQVIIILFAIAVVLYLLNYVGTLPYVPWFLQVFSKSPFSAIADACLTSAIVGFTFERLVRSEADENLHDLLRDSLSNERLFILDGIPRALLLRKDVQREILKNSKLEEIILNALQTRLGDQMGEGIYSGLVRKAITYEELWTNYRYEIFVEDILDTSIPPEVRAECFDVIMRITYDTALRKTRFLFTCASTQEQFNEIFHNPDYEVRWLMPPSDLFQSANEDSFNVLQMSVDEVSLSITSEKKPSGQFEIVCETPKLTEKIGQNVTISYTFKVKALKIGHMISTTVVYPTYDVSVEFNFAKASIDYVDVLDYFVSTRKPSIRYIPDVDNPYKITVQLKEWVFPKGGVVFVWSLKEEENLIQELRKQLQSGTSQPPNQPSQ